MIYKQADRVASQESLAVIGQLWLAGIHYLYQELASQDSLTVIRKYSQTADRDWLVSRAGGFGRILGKEV